MNAGAQRRDGDWEVRRIGPYDPTRGYRYGAAPVGFIFAGITTEFYEDEVLG